MCVCVCARMHVFVCLRQREGEREEEARRKKQGRERICSKEGGRHSEKKTERDRDEAKIESSIINSFTELSISCGSIVKNKQNTNECFMCKYGGPCEPLKSNVDKKQPSV